MNTKTKKKLVIDNPKLLKEWDFEKNGDLSPEILGSFSHKSINWECEKGHNWKARIADRSNGNGCPYCSGKITTRENSFGTKYPELIKEWDTEKNQLSPYEFLPHSNKKVYWKCRKNHSWDMKIHDRSKGHGCPYCSGKRVCIDNCLATVNPKLASEWDIKKNKPLTPFDVTPGMGRKIWWICEKGHSYDSGLNRRSSGRGCPYCSGNKVGHDNNLAARFPDVAKYWDYEKNGNLKPEDVTAFSDKSVYWTCENNHSHKTKVNLKVKSSGCSYCSGYFVSEETSIVSTYPYLMNEWDKEKNKNIDPKALSQGSQVKAFWTCEREHSWEATIHLRTSGSQCPKCFGESKTSFPEQAFFYYINKVFKKAKNRHILKRISRTLEVDIFIPSLNLALEYDGFYFHKNKIKQDEKKNKLLKEHGIDLIRIRENGLPEINMHGQTTFKCNNLDETIRMVFNHIKNNYFLNTKIKKQVEQLTIDSNSVRNEIYQMYIFIEKEKSILSKNPELSSEWNFSKNKNLLPEYFRPKSLKVVWWKCKEGHEWEKSIASRTGGSKCPYCTNLLVSDTNNLEAVAPEIAKELKNKDPKTVIATSSKKLLWECENGHTYKQTPNERIKGKSCIYCAGTRVTPGTTLISEHPDVAKFWHPTKNGALSPKNITPGSNLIVHWQCEKGHEWERMVAWMVKSKKCPYCIGRRITNENNFAALFPELAKEFDVYKNSSLKPESLTPRSSKKVWWNCPKGHNYKTSVNTRVTGSGCPYCVNLRVNKENSLHTLYPLVAAEWDSVKNELTPHDVVSGTAKKFWWNCPKGHSYEAEVRRRTNDGTGCPYCAGRKVAHDTSLEYFYPDLVKEWDYVRNNLKPSMVSPGSEKRVWWKCKEGHEWQAIVGNRTKGTGCPECYKKNRNIRKK